MLELTGLRGVVPPIATPLTPEEKVDEAGMRHLVAHLLEAGVHGVFVAGSTGEFALLRDEERRRAVELVVAEVGGKVPVFVGVGDSSTARAVDRAKEAKQLGADALVALLPYYQPTPTPDEMVAHFEGVMEATDLPLLLYNIPQRVKNVIHLDAVARLMEDTRVVGIKDSGEDIYYFHRLTLMENPSFRVFQGSEALAAASLLMGCHGIVPGIGNLVPRLCVALYDAAQAKDVPTVRSLHQNLMEINRIWWLEGTSGLGALKYALHLAGICQPHVAKPQAEPSTAARARIEGELRKVRSYL
jgi:4-hydroxy-tetrahydrodipicolinate synthase